MLSLSGMLLAQLHDFCSSQRNSKRGSQTADGTAEEQNLQWTLL